MKSERFRVFEPIEEADLKNKRQPIDPVKMYNELLSALTQMEKEANAMSVKMDTMAEELKETKDYIKQLEKEKTALEKSKDILEDKLSNQSSSKDMNETSYKTLVDELKKALENERKGRVEYEKKMMEMMDKMQVSSLMPTAKGKAPLGWQLNVTAHNAEGEIKSVDIIPKRKAGMN
jgi:predicted RNase H-like nuclease (RuvC/YqgF family)